MPLIPAYPGELESNEGIQIILKHTYKTINRHKGLSLIELLEKKNGENSKNIFIFFLKETMG